MPKLDKTHIYERLLRRLEDLREGKAVAVRDIKALLNEKQIEAMAVALEKQHELGKIHKPKNEAEKQTLGWKSKRQIYVQAYEKALIEAESTQQNDWLQKLKKAQAKATKVYMKGYFKTRSEGKSKWAAETVAKNDVVRAGFTVLRGSGLLSKRDSEINDMEEDLRKKLGIDDE